MCPSIRALLALALCAPAGAAFSLEAHLGVEGANFSLADVPRGLLFKRVYVPLHETRTIKALELRGLGFALHGSVGPSGKRDRMEIHFQRIEDRDGKTMVLPDFGPASHLAWGAQVRVTSLKLVWSHDIRGSGQDFRLRSRFGYQHVNVLQARDERVELERCFDCGYSREARRSTLAGHGLRGGFAASYRIAGPLHFESEAALGFVGAAERESRSGAADSIGGPQVFAFDVARNRRGLLAWDLAVRLRADWRRFDASLGYRLERWGGAGRYFDSDALGSFGAFAGVSCRLGKSGASPSGTRR